MTKGGVVGSGDDRIAEHLVVLRAQLGDSAAFGILFDRYHARVLAYVEHRMGSAADAEDVLQEVWVSVVRKIARLEEPQAFRAWLFRVAHRQTISKLRRTRREVTLDGEAMERELAGLVAPDDDHATAFADFESEALHRALAELSAPHREVLSLRYFEEFTYEEIAGIVGCGVGTVRSRLYYAKAALHRELISRAVSHPHNGDDR